MVLCLKIEVQKMRIRLVLIVLQSVKLLISQSVLIFRMVQFQLCNEKCFHFIGIWKVCYEMINHLLIRKSF